MLKSKFENFLSFIENKKITILTHDLVDIDAFVSCLTLNYFLNQYFKKPITAVIFSEILKYLSKAWSSSSCQKRESCWARRVR